MAKILPTLSTDCACCLQPTKDVCSLPNCNYRMCQTCRDRWKQSPACDGKCPACRREKKTCCAWCSLHLLPWIPTIQVEIRYDPHLRHQHAMVLLLTVSVVLLIIGWLLLGNFFFCALFARLCPTPWDHGWWFRGLGGVLILILWIAIVLRCLCACFNCYHCVRLHVVEER